MVPLLGILVVLVSVAAGFVLEGGHPVDLVRPEEVLIIAGGALGASMACGGVGDSKRLVSAAVAAFRAPRIDRRSYLASLVTLLAVFDFARRASQSAVENDLEASASSLVGRCSANFPVPLAVDFVCDTVRLATFGMAPAADLDWMLEAETEESRRVRAGPAEAAYVLADALPGFGVAAAVLGIVVTMGVMDRSPTVMGAKIASALLGTFLGIFLCYGFAGPLASRMSGAADAESKFLEVMRAGLSGYVKGMPAGVAVEFARRAIPPGLRPSFEAVESAWLDELATVGRTLGHRSRDGPGTRSP